MQAYLPKVSQSRWSTDVKHRPLSQWLGDMVDHVIGRKNKPAPKPLPVVRQELFVYQNQIIPYRLVRRPRKSIGLRIDEEGLKVSAPAWLGHASIEKALEEKAAWILKQIKGLASLPPQGQDPYQTFIDKGEVLIRGCPVRIDDRVQHAKLPREALMTALKKEAREDFETRIRYFSKVMGCVPSRWQLSSARRRWGSCNAQAVIRLNWRLIHLDPRLIDYVVVHELAHLKELNHSPKFWAIVESVLPDYRERRQLLRHDQPSGFTL